eukprot:scaffold24175_cov60-Phaeocystis_antarctica.AAC.1
MHASPTNTACGARRLLVKCGLRLSKYPHPPTTVHSEPGESVCRVYIPCRTQARLLDRRGRTRGPEK